VFASGSSTIVTNPVAGDAFGGASASPVKSVSNVNGAACAATANSQATAIRARSDDFIEAPRASKTDRRPGTAVAKLESKRHASTIIQRVAYSPARVT
jgi:hypothetical protein